MSKSVYSMSAMGSCPRVLAAEKLGHEAPPMTSEDLTRLEYYTMCEDIAAKQITNLGYELEPSTLCQTCLEKYGNTRYGIHVEIDTPLFVLLGHLDRRLILPNRRLPVEIKSAGRFIWPKFAKEEFNAFTGYAGQEACYLEAEQSPGIYWVLNRDTGEPLKYIVNDFKNEINLEGFKKITLPVTYEEIIDKLNQVEIAVQYGELPEGEDSDNCRYCKYGFLCSKAPKIESEDKTEVIKIPSLVEAARMYRQGHAMEGEGKSLKETAVISLLSHAKDNNIPKYKVGGVSFSYQGQKQKEYLDSEIIKASVSEEIIRLATKKGKVYDAYTARVLKEE